MRIWWYEDITWDWWYGDMKILHGIARPKLPPSPAMSWTRPPHARCSPEHTHLNPSQPISTHLNPSEHPSQPISQSSSLATHFLLVVESHYLYLSISSNILSDACTATYALNLATFVRKPMNLFWKRKRLKSRLAGEKKRDREHTWTHGVVNRGLRIVHVHQRWANSGFFLLQIQIRILFGSVNLTKYKHEY